GSEGPLLPRGMEALCAAERFRRVHSGCQCPWRHELDGRTVCRGSECGPRSAPDRVGSELHPLEHELYLGYMDERPVCVQRYDHLAASARYDKKWFDQGLRSTVFKNAPAGILFPGDPGVANIGTSENETRWMHFAPRLGLALDPKGDGMTVVRAAYGIFFDYP